MSRAIRRAAIVGRVQHRAGPPPGRLDVADACCSTPCRVPWPRPDCRSTTSTESALRPSPAGSSTTCRSGRRGSVRSSAWRWCRRRSPRSSTARPRSWSSPRPRPASTPTARPPRRGRVRRTSSSRPFGLFTAAEFALIARRHMAVYGTTPEQLATVAAIIRNNGHLNPEAVYYGRGPFKPEDILASRLVADPFHLLDCSMTSEGGCALVIARGDRQRFGDHRAGYVRGFAADHFGPAYQLPPSYDLSGRRGEYDNGLVGARAAELAFRQAGLTRSDVDLLELYDPFSFEVIRQLEAFGFCGPGEGGPFVADGQVGPAGRYPINTDGGLMSFSHAGANPQMLQRAVRAVQQLQGSAGELQVPDARVALCSSGGAGALFNCVMLLGAGAVVSTPLQVPRARRPARSARPGLGPVLGRLRARRAALPAVPIVWRGGVPGHRGLPPLPGPGPRLAHQRGHRTSLQLDRRLAAGDSGLPCALRPGDRRCRRGVPAGHQPGRRHRRGALRRSAGRRRVPRRRRADLALLHTRTSSTHHRR